MTHRFSFYVLCAAVSIFSYASVIVAKYKPDDTGDCSICLDPLKNSQDPRALSVLNCNHLFHIECIQQCKANKSSVSCPNCRQEHKGPLVVYVQQEEKKEEQKQPSAPVQNALTGVNLDEQQAILADIEAEKARKQKALTEEEYKQRTLADKLVMEQATQRSLQTAPKAKEQKLSREEAAQIAAAEKASRKTLITDEKARKHRAGQQREQDRLAVQQTEANSKKTAEQEQQKRDAQNNDAEIGRTVRALWNLLFGK